MADQRQIAAGVIDKAKETIMKLRPGVHGDAENSFQMIADFWTVYIKHAMIARRRTVVELDGRDVAQMMTLLKKARTLFGDAKNDDNFVDDIGYAALAAMLQLPGAEPDHFDQEIEKAMGFQTDTPIKSITPVGGKIVGSV